MSRQYYTKNGHTTKRGAFIDRKWYCDCEPRKPAEKFQTKNGGKNHGRWFYICRRSQPKRCPFFLWFDDAKIREEAEVINNSTTEPTLETQPQTPRKPLPQAQPITPVSKTKPTLGKSAFPLREEDDSQATVDFEYEQSLLGSHGQDSGRAVGAGNINLEFDEHARKVPRTPQFDSPRKRTLDEMNNSHTEPSTINTDDVFRTPPTSRKVIGLMSPIKTINLQAQHGQTHSTMSSLAAEVLEILQPVKLSANTEEQLVEYLNRFDLRTQGIVKGRDITRLAVQAKEKKITELQARITSLEAERETSRTVIAHLKHDIATSPRRNRRPPNTRSES